MHTSFSVNMPSRPCDSLVTEYQNHEPRIQQGIISLAGPSVVSNLLRGVTIFSDCQINVGTQSMKAVTGNCKANATKRKAVTETGTAKRHKSNYDWRGQDFVARILIKKGGLAAKFPHLTGRPPD